MGTDKARLLWGDVPLLLRVIDRLAPLASSVVVAARPGQELPVGDYLRVDDRRPGEGPLAGLAQGLEAAGGGTSVPVAVAACDYPFAEPALYSALLAAAPGAAAVIPRLAGHAHPLAAVWRSDAAAACARCLARGARRVQAALDEVGAVELSVDDAEGFDPFRSLLNVNDPVALERALREAP